MFQKIKKFIFKYRITLVCLLFYAMIFSFLTFIYYKRLAAFGCSDDCFNYIGGFLLNKGKTIYSDFFFNHNMLMAYFSAIVQKVAQPTTLYELILYHRVSLYAFSFLMGILTIIRFNKTGFLALIFYEATKFYVFGDHFLAESFIVYPLIYMLGVCFEKLNDRKVYAFDIISGGIFAWFVIFSREPYVPLALILYGAMLIGGKELKVKLASFSIFVILSLITIATVPFHDFILNIYTYNKVTINGEFERNGLTGASLLNIFFYPVKVFVVGINNLFRQTLITFSFVFISAGLIYSFVLRKKAFIFLFLVLGISNLRPVIPGTIYYEAFHINVWYGLFIFSTFLLLNELSKSLKTKKIYYALLTILFIFAAYVIISPSYFVKEKPDRITEFNTNYGTYYTYGTVVKTLSNKNDTLFLEDTDDPIYWVADIGYSYKYYWYTSHMPKIKIYKQARDEMFVNNPPDFYYDACKLISYRSWLKFSEELAPTYTRLNVNGKRSCLLVKNSKLKTISEEQVNAIKPLGFSLK